VRHGNPKQQNCIRNRTKSIQWNRRNSHVVFDLLSNFCLQVVARRRVQRAASVSKNLGNVRRNSVVWSVEFQAVPCILCAFWIKLNKSVVV
jgi:hypothetical protein